MASAALALPRRLGLRLRRGFRGPGGLLPLFSGLFNWFVLFRCGLGPAARGQQAGGGVHDHVAGQGVGLVEVGKLRLDRPGGGSGRQGLLQGGAVALAPLAALFGGGLPGWLRLGAIFPISCK